MEIIEAGFNFYAKIKQRWKVVYFLEGFVVQNQEGFQGFFGSLLTAIDCSIEIWIRVGRKFTR